jgi:hypothetical protein
MYMGAVEGMMRPHSGVMDIIVVQSESHCDCDDNSHVMKSTRQGDHVLIKDSKALVSTDWEVLIGWDALSGFLANSWATADDASGGVSRTCQLRVSINSVVQPSLAMSVGADGRCKFADGTIQPPRDALEKAGLKEGNNHVSAGLDCL